MPTDPTPTPWPYPPDTGRTHYDGCWRERGHHNCAVAQVDTLAAQLAAVRAERDALRMLVASDAHAMQYQTLGQYRTALLRLLDTPPLRVLVTPARPTDTGRDG